LIFARDNRLPALAQLDGARTLILGGDHDIPRPPPEGQRMADLIDCDFIPIPGAGHISNLENPDFATNTLLQWLRQ
jgi:pimeloyl-ACP methyl ester carboxylesterase